MSDNPRAYTFGPAGLMPLKVEESAAAYTAPSYGSSIGFSEADGPKLLKRIRDGFPFPTFLKLQKALGVPAKQLAEVVHIPVRTLNRRKEQGRFDISESERIFRIAALFDHAVAVLGTETDASDWLLKPVKGLGYQVPLHHADTEPGAAEVHDLLGRIEHGIFT